MRIYMMIAAVSVMLVPPVLMVQTPLQLPQTPDEVRKYMDDPAATACPACGVVTNVRRIAAGDEVAGVAGSEDAAAQSADARTLPKGDPGPGRDVPTVTVMGTGDESRQARQERGRRQAKQGEWRVTVRYDDGSYASFDQSERPVVAKGDRVQVVAGRVERR